VENFKYLGVILNEENNNQIDLQERMKKFQKKFFMLQKMLKIKHIKEIIIKNNEHNNR